MALFNLADVEAKAKEAADFAARSDIEEGARLYYSMRAQSLWRLALAVRAHAEVERNLGEEV